MIGYISIGSYRINILNAHTREMVTTQVKVVKSLYTEVRNVQHVA